jgi:lipoyl(octanoyl) transferase
VVPPRWRLILGRGAPAVPRIAATPGALNMAVDHALLESVQAGGPPVLRLYTWEPACLSLGRNQHARGLYDPGRLAQAGVDVVRRPTGGLAVLHDRELTYCVLAPAPLLGGARAAYRLINAALVDGLRRIGVPAGVALTGAAPNPRRDAADPCFQAPAGGEVVVAGRKLIGSAQRCERRTILQHGSILLGGSQAAVLALLQHPGHGADDAGRSVTMAELLGREPAAAEVAPAIAAGFERRCGIRLAPDSLTDEEDIRAKALQDVYGAPHWTWRH